MQPTARARRIVARVLLGIVLGVSVGPACSAPQRVHAPIEYPPDVRLACSAVDLTVTDPRLPSASGAAPGARQLGWPQDFEATARTHLTQVVGGRGPELVIATRVGAADEIELVDARGEVTRVSVTLHFDVSVKGGPVLRRAEAQSSYDIPRAEASPEEIEVVLSATAVDAFDRYWANPTTLSTLNRELEAHAKRHGEAPAVPAAP
jgi:hypothetical protein